MVDYSNEDDVKKALNIDSWRHLSKDKFLSFVAEMPKMEKEVALKIIEQFPDFKSLAEGSLNSVEEQYKNALRVNWKSQKQVHRAFREYREVLSRELNRDNLTMEDRFVILQMIRDAVTSESQKDSEHKAFVTRALAIVATTAVVVAGTGIAFVGGKMSIGQNNDA